MCFFRPQDCGTGKLMGLPGAHSKLWLHQSSVTVSYLPYQLLHFTTLLWFGRSSPELQLLIPSNNLSLLCACGRTHPSIHLPIIHLLTYPSVHSPIQPFSYSAVLSSISALSFHLPSLSTILPFIHPSIYSSTYPPVLPTIYVLINLHIKHSLFSHQVRPALKDGF